MFVQDGYFDIGISGHDWVRESEADVVEVAELPYAKTGTGFVQMVLAVPQESPIESASDIAPGSRITTEFPKATKAFFDELGIDVEVHFSYGATEAKVPEMMDALVDLTETGSTLRRNGLKIVDTVLTSTTRLLASKEAWADPREEAGYRGDPYAPPRRHRGPGARTALDERGRGGHRAVVAELPAMKKPTVNQLYGSDDYEITTVADKATVNILIPRLKAAGAEDILEVPISKIVR